MNIFKDADYAFRSKYAQIILYRGRTVNTGKNMLRLTRFIAV
jgi:hypothetical protein